MGRARYARHATLIKTLVFFDGPQLALLESDRQGKMLAVACDNRNYGYPFFAVEISTKLLHRYLEQRVDLRYVFRQREKSKVFYFFDWANLDGMTVFLKRATIEEINNNDFYPEAGFFAQEHTSEYKIERILESSERKFIIDGKWNASDFSRFYSRFADIYAFALLNSAAIREKVSPFDLTIIQNAISSYPWAGGSSYVSFYNGLMESVRALNPLNVSRVNFASLGSISFEGGKEALDEIVKAIKCYSQNDLLIHDIVKEITHILEREGLRGATADEKFSTDYIINLIMKHTDDLAHLLGIEDSRETLMLCGGNKLIYVKMILSYYRRAKALAGFYAEGRVKIGDVANTLSIAATPKP